MTSESINRRAIKLWIFWHELWCGKGGIVIHFSRPPARLHYSCKCEGEVSRPMNLDEIKWVNDSIGESKLKER